MGARWNLDAVADAFAAASVDPTNWIAATERAVSETGSFGAVLVPVRGRTPRQAVVTESFAPAIERYFSEGWVHSDERLRGVPLLEARGVFSDLDFINPDQIAHNPYYQEWLAPHDLRWFACVKVAVGDDLWALSIQRTIAQGPFTPLQLSRLAKLSGSLASAGALARALGFARAEAALAAFEMSGHAVALLDRFGKVIRINVSAERLFGSDPKIIQGRIIASDRAAASALDRALHALLWSSSGVALMPPIVMPREDKRPLLAYLIRPPAICADALSPCQAVVVLVDPDANPAPPHEHLRIAFGLSAAEARLAARLAGGERLESAADALGIAYETARTQLKRVFAKLEISRQSELVALLGRLPTA